jgi:hypothetical protein
MTPRERRDKLIADAGKLRWRKARIRILYGDKTKRMAGERIGSGLGVHKHLLFLGEWTVTHIPTGLKFPGTFLSKDAAMVFALRIYGMAKWGDLKTTDEVKAAVKQRTRKTIAALAEDPFR